MGLYRHALSLPELNEAWTSVFSRESPLWRSVGGPVSALRKSLERISWSMPSFATLITDSGLKVVLTEFSPRLVKSLLRAAVRRTLEWDLGARFNLEGRACVDGAFAYLNSSRYSLFEKGCMRALTCQAIYTRDRAASLGYILPSTSCPLCGGAVDTLRHRLWQCPSVSDIRDECVSTKVQEWASEADDLLACYGIFPHPGDSFPGAMSSGGVEVQWLDGGPEDLESYAFEGDIFVDGSCSRGVVRELNRAAWAFTL
eukprot:9472747-Pyramimonas_sp.AAC.1